MSRHSRKGTVQPYGLFNPEDKQEGVIYKANVPDVILGIILVETE